MSFPLDLPNRSLVQQLLEQPYPHPPRGIGLGPAAFNLTLHPAFPVTVATVYAIASHWANHRLAKLKAKGVTPKDHIKSSWTLSQLALAHNVGLSLYSAWTAINVIVRLVEYMGRGFAEGGFAGWTAAYCNIPTWDASSDGLGRFVALFYYSKFYEVVDSLILVLKGKPVSTLQTYHHAGAMLTMWAGTRYSVTPIWIFASWNGTIHAFMYMHYTASLLKLRMPRFFKQAMTTAQIAKLFFGSIVASSYFFVRYSLSAYPSMALPSVGYVPTPDASVGGGLVKGGFNATQTSFSLDAQYRPYWSEAATLKALRSTADAQGNVSCLSSTGQAFAVALNVAYLMPLIALFVQFYVRSYLKPATARATAAAKGKKAE